MAVLKAYFAGGQGTCGTIEALGMEDDADLLIALAQADLPFPPPARSALLDRHREAAAAILMPLLLRS